MTQRRAGSQSALRVALGALFIGAGAIQATHRQLFSALVPAPFQEHRDQLQTAVTGALGAIGVSFLVPGLRPVARWPTTLMLGGTLPAAINQVRRPEHTDSLGIPRPVVIMRVPAQALVIAAAWYATANHQ